LPIDGESSGQRGAYAVEFALVFPLFFLIIYATLTYGLIFTAQQSLNYAAQSGARAALEYQPTLADRAESALEVAKDQSGWVGALGGASPSITVCGGPGGGVLASSGDASGCASLDTSDGADPLLVTVRYPYLTAPLVPLLGPSSLMGFAVPTTLAAASQVNLAIAQGATGG
jgi:Flp pilus assembly protein TadG